MPLGRQRWNIDAVCRGQAGADSGAGGAYGVSGKGVAAGRAVIDGPTKRIGPPGAVTGPVSSGVVKATAQRDPSRLRDTG